MAKKIQFSNDDITLFLEQIKSNLTNRKFGPNDIEVTISNTGDDRRAAIIFEPKAWIKMKGLVEKFEGEVQWHGTVARAAPDTFVIDEVYIFPHEVTSASVISDQAEYEKWLNELDDHIFNRLRFHGHSHVNMHVSPSSVDEKFRESILSNFGTPSAGEDVFYIFLILNKDGDISGIIYDFTNNAVYDTNDITVLVRCGETELLSEFIRDARSVTREPKPAQTAYSGYGYGNQMGYGNNYQRNYSGDNPNGEHNKKKQKKADKTISGGTNKYESDYFYEDNYSYYRGY